MRLVRTAWPQLAARRGSVLNIIGIGAHTPGADFTIGGSVNGAFQTFTKALADVGQRDGVRVNGINPGFIRTDRLRRMLEATAARDATDVGTAERQLLARIQSVRIGEAEDVAELAAFVLSAKGSLLHGALLDIDGGQTKTV